MCAWSGDHFHILMTVIVERRDWFRILGGLSCFFVIVRVCRRFEEMGAERLLEVFMGDASGALEDVSTKTLPIPHLFRVATPCSTQYAYNSPGPQTELGFPPWSPAGF